MSNFTSCVHDGYSAFLPMTSSSSPTSSFHSASSFLAESVLNNHVPPESAPEDVASSSPVNDRQSIVDALTETEGAIRKIEVSAPMYILTKRRS